MNFNKKRIVIDNKDTNYFITNDGIVFNTEGRILTTFVSNSGYKRVTLFINKKRIKYSIHRLVAMMFIGELGDNVVNHKDGNKMNNSVENLEIITQKENSHHASENDLVIYGEEHYKSKYSEDDIHRICKLLESGKSRDEARIMLGLPRKLIDNVAIGYCWRRISSKYNLPPVENRIRYSKEDEDKICEYIRSGLKNSDIINKLGVSGKEADSLRYKLKRLRHKCSTTILK